MNLIKEISAGSAEEMNVIVEIPKGSKNKYEIDKETGLIALDRVMHTSQDMPFDYGFVPQTLWEDGDPLDVVILTTYPLHPGILAKVRPVGMMDMVDDGESDVKIIAVPVKDPRWSEVKDLSDVNKHTLKEMEHYFTTYKKLQHKEVVIRGFGDKQAAMDAFTKATDAFKA
jgi:inorganic pyrophosphatase